MLTPKDLHELFLRVPNLAKGINVVLLENIRQVAHEVEPVHIQQRLKPLWDEVTWTEYAMALGHTMARMDIEKRRLL